MRARRRTFALVAFGFTVYSLALSARADVRLPNILADGIVLQQEADATLWGFADAGEQITIKPGWSEDATTTTADEKGRWRASLHTPSAGGPFEIAIAGKTTVTLHDVLVGEVWVCSGQSNMEWPMTLVDRSDEEIAAADFPQIRLFHVERARADKPAENCNGAWQHCTPAADRDFSAVAYFFARHLHRELKVPVGVIESAWGGTEVEPWMPLESIRAIPEMAESLDHLADDVKKYEQEEEAWLKKCAAADAGDGKWHAADLDDADWKPVAKLGVWDGDLAKFDGVIWYRAKLDVAKDGEGRPAVIELGAIDDEDVTWINGRQIGATTRHDAPRRYEIPAGLLKAGVNSLVIRVRDKGFVGGFTTLADEKPFVAIGSERVSPAGWHMKIGVDQKDLPPEPQRPSRDASSLYNAMIAPLQPLAVRGFTWYQGESNVARAMQYRKSFPAMIRGWRTAWNRGDLPFYFVQIAPFDYSGLLRNVPLDPGCAAAELRESQCKALSLPNTGMVVTTDITANPKDIHPRNKQEVGRRLALWALARTYNQPELTCSGPLFKSASFGDEGAWLDFDHVGRGLMSRGDITCVEVAGEDRVFKVAKARIVGNRLLVFDPSGLPVVAVRFGWSDSAQPNLFNEDGLPASPFRTDDWPGATDKRKW